MADALEVRVSALEREMERVCELVDGHQKWSHRTRLHALEDNDRGVALATEAMNALRKTQALERASRANRFVQLREWGSAAAALAAIVVAVWK